MSETIPLFPLNLVLFPGCRIPLHIFEDRYRQMIGECLENETEFGMVCGSDDEFAPVGCAARVTDVVNRFADGRLNIIIEGTDRFRMVERGEDRPYITGTVERIPDEPGAPDEALLASTRALYVEALKLSIGWYRAPAAQEDDPGTLSYAIASALGIPLERQQTLLEQTSVPQRFRLLKDMLEKALVGLREHARKVSGNGKVH